jgi:predicted O-methyltransferase YrrM
LSYSPHEIHILDHRVDKYLLALLPKRDPVLRSLEEDAEKRSVPIIGPLCASVISILLKSFKAEKALEIGTATGYSGIWIARALSGKSARLTTIEMDPSRRREAQQNFQKAGVSRKVKMLSGNAAEIVPELAKSNPKSFDAVFLDVGDKTLYVKLLEHCIALLREGGFLIADNTLWGGQVADPHDRSKPTTVIRKFNKLVLSDKRLDASIIPLRDGFTIARKKSNK